MNAARRAVKIFAIPTIARARADHRHPPGGVMHRTVRGRAKLILLPAARQARRRREARAAAILLAAVMLLGAAVGRLYLSW